MRAQRREPGSAGSGGTRTVRSNPSLRAPETRVTRRGGEPAGRLPVRCPHGPSPSGQLPARACACACAALLLLPAAALAEVLSVAGDVIHATPPEPSLAAGNNRSPTAWAFVDYPRFGVDVTTPGSDRLYGEIPVGRWGAGAMPPPTSASRSARPTSSPRTSSTWTTPRRAPAATGGRDLRRRDRRHLRHRRSPHGQRPVHRPRLLGRHGPGTEVFSNDTEETSSSACPTG